MTDLDKHADVRHLYAEGSRTFQLLFTRWMDTNEWSHPVMTRLAKAALNDVGWLHSSQISGLRHGKLESPGPRTFLAIERLNFYLHRYATEKKLIPNTDSSNSYSKAFAITEDGKAPSLGWWVEVFCGVRKPKDIDLGESWFSEPMASELSASWGTLIRKLFRDQDRDLIVELDSVIRQNYPARDQRRIERLRAVIQAQGTWTAEELTTELPAISALTASLGGPATESELMACLQIH
jgi:hypothetical protein